MLTTGTVTHVESVRRSGGGKGVVRGVMCVRMAPVSQVV